MNYMWIWLVAGLILVYLMILANQPKTDTNESWKKKVSGLQGREIDDRNLELFDDEDDLIEEFLIIDLLDEEDEEI